MTEWWTLHDGTLVGAIGGSALGVGAGMYGALIGWFAPKGIGRRVFIPIHVGMVAMGIASLLAGLVAVIGRQPYHVFYPLLMIGGLLTLLMGGLLPVVLMRFRQAEARRMDAQLLRSGSPGAKGDRPRPTPGPTSSGSPPATGAPPPSLSFPDRFRTWYAYERDCNAKTLAMLDSIPRERRSDPNFQRALDKMAHVIAARQAWLYRLDRWPDRPATFFPLGTTLADLPPRVQAIEEAWTTYLSTLTEQTLRSEFTFTTSTGERWQWNVLDLLTQVFGHAWYHRGQVATLVKDLGGKVVDTDYVYWCGTPKKLDPQP